MSHSTLLGFVRDDDQLTGLWEGGNSAGTAAVVWSTMTKDWQDHHDEYMYNQRSLDELFADALSGETRMCFEDRVMTRLTGWQVFIPIEHAPELPTVIRKWLELHAETMASKVNHWPAVADVIEQLDDPDLVGLGMWHTSVTDNPYDRHVKAGYDRFFKWQKAHWAHIPVEELDVVDLDQIRTLAPVTL